MDLGALVPLPALKTLCGYGEFQFGMAVCPTLGLLVTSEDNNNNNTLSVFALPRSSGAGAGSGAGLALVCTLRGSRQCRWAAASSLRPAVHW